MVGEGEPFSFCIVRTRDLPCTSVAPKWTGYEVEEICHREQGLSKVEGQVGEKLKS